MVRLPETRFRERKMDEEMKDFMRKAYEGDEIDLDYEFDAPKFYDFTQPDSDLEATEAEDWFQFAGSYPPSRKRFRETFVCYFASSYSQTMNLDHLQSRPFQLTIVSAI